MVTSVWVAGIIVRLVNEAVKCWDALWVGLLKTWPKF
jgi:hypothetical protein